MTSANIRVKYLKFFESKGHKIIPSASLLPENDSSTLFISSGMQPLIPFLMGEKHPEGVRLTNSQKSLRVEDIDEVGDGRHTTYFEMLGNWSLGDYFKKEQLKEDKRAIEYKKLDLEPMYYTDDSRDNNPEIEKTITKDIEEDDESALEVERVEEEVEKPKEDLIPVLSMVESQAIDLRDNKKQEVIKRPAKQLVKRERLLPHRSPVRLPMVRIMASVVVLIGLLFVAGTFVLQQTIHYTYSDSVVNTEFQLAGVSGLFDF